ncbi:MAG: transposase, partial [Paludibacteraceae bacterium]
KASRVLVKHYKTDQCTSCSEMDRCTKSQTGRCLERSQYQENIEDNARRIAQNKDLYRQRQAIVEHPFGIIKRQWDFYYIMTKKNNQTGIGRRGIGFLRL